MRIHTMNVNSISVSSLAVRSLAVGTLVIGAAVIGATALLSGQPAFAAEDKNKQKVSKELAPTLKAAQDALQAKKFPEALAKLKDAEGNPKKTPYDQHIINELAGVAYAKTSNYPEASKAFEAEINDGFLDEKEVPGRVKAVAQIAYQLKNYDKAIEYGNRAIKGGYADEEMKTLVGQSYYLKGDYKGTLKYYDSLIDGQLKAGQTPKDEAMQLALSACVKLNDSDCTTKELKRLVEYHPKTEEGQQLLYSLRSSPNQTDKSTLQVYRLMSEVDALKEPNDYTEMAQLAIEQGNHDEAER